MPVKNNFKVNKENVQKQCCITAAKTRKLESLIATHKEGVLTSLSFLDVNTPLVLFIAKYVFPEI